MSNLLFSVARFLKKIRDFIAIISHHMNDKALHFLVLGFTGLIILGITYPIIKRLDKRSNSFAMASVYTGTILIIFNVSMAAVQEVNSQEILLLLLFALIIFFISYRMFKHLDCKNKTLRIANFFTTTMVIIFAIWIEFCQGLTKTGKVELADSLFGIAGYITMYLILHIIMGIARLVRKRIQSKTKKNH